MREAAKHRAGDAGADADDDEPGVAANPLQQQEPAGRAEHERNQRPAVLDGGLSASLYSKSNIWLR